MLSVIVPIYNAEKYLKRCVASILSQRWLELELILVDDGSKDGSGRLCDELASTDARCKVIHKPNGGVSSARNAGLAAATGEFVAFVDSDDYCAPDMYEKLFAKVEDGVDIVQCDFMLDYGDSLARGALYDISDSKNKMLHGFFLSGWGGSCWNMIIRRTLVVNNHLTFPEYISCGEDFWFVLRLLTYANKIAKIYEPLYFYNRTNDSSLTRSLNMEVNLKTMKGYEESIQFLQTMGLWDDLQEPLSWNVLRFKSSFLFDLKGCRLFRECVPLANNYISNCPLLSSRMKFIMKLVRAHLDLPALGLTSIYRLANR